MWTKYPSWLGVRLVISRPLVRFRALGTWVSPWARQFIPYCLSLPSCKKWISSIKKAVLRAWAICCQLLWNIPWGIEMVLVCTCVLG